MAAPDLTNTEIRIIIAYDPKTGKVAMNGPLTDKILCYGLLEMARQIVGQRNVEEKKVIVPTMLPPKLGGN